MSETETILINNYKELHDDYQRKIHIISRLESENLAANKRIEELFKEKQELERKYNLLKYGSD